MNLAHRLPLVLISLTFSALIVGCGKENSKVIQGQLDNNQITPGTYTSERCFLNKIETQTTLQNKWSKATIVFNNDLTGSGHFVTFTDAACTAQVSDTTFTFSGAKVNRIGGVAVISFTQSGTVVNPTWWIPANVSDTGYSFDVDFTDGESGPYIVEPTPTQLSGFAQNPQDGVSFKKQ